MAFTFPSDHPSTRAHTNLTLALTELTFAIDILKLLDKQEEVRAFTRHREALAFYASDWSPPDAKLPWRPRDTTDALASLQEAVELVWNEDDMLWQDEARELREEVEAWVVRIDEAHA